MPTIRTTGTDYAISDDAALGIESPAGMQILSITRSDETTELEPVKNDSGNTTTRAFVNAAEKVSLEVLIEPGTAIPKKGDVFPLKAYRSDAAAKNFVIDTVSDSVSVGEYIRVSIDATYHPEVAAAVA